MTQTTKIVPGHELKVGDRIAPWGGRTTTITDLTPYMGPLSHLWAHNAKVATLQCAHPLDAWTGASLTIDPLGLYLVVSEAEASA